MRSHSKALFAVAALFAFLLVPSSALAGKSVERLVPTGGIAGGVAVNTTTGDLYVQIIDGDRIERYSSDGTFLGQFGSNGSGDGDFDFDGYISQLAIDQSDGSLYVPDAGNDRIQKFQADGTFLDAFGSPGIGPGELDLGVANPNYPLGGGLAIDPSTGDVYATDPGNDRVQRFDSSGSFELSFGNSFEGVFGPDSLLEPRQVSVDSSGRVYVVANRGGNEPRISRFTSAGEFDGFDSVQNNIGEPETVAVDPSDDHFYSTAIAYSLSPVRAISEFDNAGTAIDRHGIHAPALNAGLALDAGADPIYATEGETSRVLVLTDSGPIPPVVTVSPPTAVGTKTATFHGTVNPDGTLPSNWHFEYSTDGVNWISTSGGQVPAGTSAVSVEETVQGLAPNIEFHLRLAASPAFSDQATTSTETTFTTEAVPPSVEPLYAGIPTDTQAWLGAKVNPENALTTFHIEYSTDLDFANSVNTQDASAGHGGQLTIANKLVTGLQPRTTYYFRVVASNLAGTVVGDPRSFETLATVEPQNGLPDGRVWEKVSPADKQGADVYRGNLSSVPTTSTKFQASLSGQSVTYSSEGKFGGESGPAFSQYIARRGPDGWVTEGLNSFHEPGLGFQNYNRYEWFSNDLSKGVASSSAALNEGDPTGVQGLYLRNIKGGTYSSLLNGVGSAPKSALFDVRAASPNGDRIAFSNRYAIPATLYEWSADTGARIVGVSPVGTPPMSPDASIDIGRGRGGFGAGGDAVGLNPISQDGSRLFFNAADHGPPGLYVRENGKSTTLISASERTGDDPSMSRSAEFLAASPDGETVFFRSQVPLTDNLMEGDFIGYLYRWSAEGPPGERLTVLATVDLGITKKALSESFAEVGVSDDGRSYYFTAADLIEPEAGDSGRRVLYLWREGEGIRLIAKLAFPTDQGLWSSGLIGNFGISGSRYRSARVTPDGRFIAFASSEALTAYDTNGKQQIYLYDSHSDQLTCVSCSTFQAKSKDRSWISSCSEEGAGCDSVGQYLAHNLTDDGGRFFFDSNDALVPRDTNGTLDVYEWSKGRVHLLSSGTSSSYSSFVDASSSGDDVFFTTGQRLVASDKDDLHDLYDARVGGTPEPGIDLPCVADECQGTPAPPPGFQTPSSAGFSGQGNAKAAKPRCRKGRTRRKNRCVASKGKRQHGGKRKRENHNRRAGR